MPTLYNKHRSAYSPDELSVLESELEDYWNHARKAESETIKDVEKHLWLANGAAVTASIGFLQAKVVPSCWQTLGAWAFLLGIVLLVVMKFVSATQASRMRYRFQEAKTRFDANQTDDMVFASLRDETFEIGRRVYLSLQWGSGIAFLVGVTLTLIGVTSAV